MGGFWNLNGVISNVFSAGTEFASLFIGKFLGYSSDEVFKGIYFLNLMMMPLMKHLNPQYLPYFSVGECLFFVGMVCVMCECSFLSDV